MSQDILSTFNNARPPLLVSEWYSFFFYHSPLYGKSQYSYLLSKANVHGFFWCQYDSSMTYNSFSSTIILVFLTKASPHKSFDSSNFSNSWSSNLRRFFLIDHLPDWTQRGFLPTWMVVQSSDRTSSILGLLYLFFCNIQYHYFWTC